ncbi:hypothetical protein VL04_17510 [Chromobacterium violaceum]|nr:hypothetical protein VK93_14775 [Chromobacterium violaceum]KMN87859.1 hypothetical protein VL02_00770 [Chromobacterium violaceum]KMN89088.1 hypothetical protein VL04_17510 [Chromobacterium violaceum]KMO05462.1 hypothetical protein VL16_02755 [Chromobacterium violaceum]
MSFKTENFSFDDLKTKISLESGRVYVTREIVLRDNQTISIVVHLPDNDQLTLQDIHQGSIRKAISILTELVE